MLAASNTLILGSGSDAPQGKSQRVSTSIKTIAPTGRIGVELACIKCSHVLRGVAIAARCPECGEPVASTLAARTLENIDDARGGLEDYGGTVKMSSLALIGVLLLPVLGPLTAVVLSGAAFVRVSSTGRIMRSGLCRTSSLGSSCRMSHVFAWPVAVWASITTIALLHDAIGRWGIWLSPAGARAMVLIWIAMVIIEVAVAIIIARRAAGIIEVQWFAHLLRAAIAALGVGVAIQLLLILLPSSTGGAWLIFGQVVFAWIPLIAGCWLLGTLIQRLGDVANDMHWTAVSGSDPTEAG